MTQFLKENGKFDLSAIMKRAIKQARTEVAACKRLGYKTTWKKELSAALKSVWSMVKQITAFDRGATVEITSAQYQAMKA